MQYHVTVPECEQFLLDQGKNVVVLKPYQPIISQLLVIPSGSEIMASPPDSWPKVEQERFALRVHESILNIEISRNTVTAFKDQWEENAFWNHESTMTAIPIDKIPKSACEIAVIIGGGPSAKGFYCLDEWMPFASWSSGYPGEYIGHCDHRSLEIDIPEESAIIFTPVASPDFVSKGTSPKYVYLDRGNPISWRFAEARGVPEHEPIVGNVVDMLIQCAIYGGYKIIKLIGVDLSCKEPAELFKYHPSTVEAVPAINYRGEVVYTDEIFQVYQKGIEGLVERYPEIEFSVLSDEGVILKGVPFEQINP